VARYLTFGHLLVEDTVLPDGRKVLGRLGGDSIYAAMGARVWANDVLPVARVGRDLPAPLLERLQSAGYGDGLVPREGPSIRMWVHWGAEGKRRFAFRNGSGTYEELTVRPDEIPSGLAQDVEAVHFAPLPLPLLEPLVCWARPRARVVTLDPHYEHVEGNSAAWRRLLPLVDVFLPSRNETADLLGTWAGPEDAAFALASLGAPIVVLKLGAEGALAYRAADEAFVRVASVVHEPVDATGSGDAFCGGFLVGFTETADLGVALAQGAVSASFAAEDYGCEHALEPNREEARRRLRTLAQPIAVRAR
jgi:ribokinase